MTAAPMRHFVAVFRSRSAIRFREDDTHGVRHTFEEGEPPVDLTFRTWWIDEGYEAMVPRGLHVEAAGFAPSLRAAMERFRIAADNITVLMSVSANAASEPSLIQVAYDTTPGHDRHDFFQNLVPIDTGMPNDGRRPDPEATGEFIQAITSHPDSGRLLRGVAQYTHAIQHWSLGEELEAVSHL